MSYTNLEGMRNVPGSLFKPLNGSSPGSTYINHHQRRRVRGYLRESLYHHGCSFAVRYARSTVLWRKAGNAAAPTIFGNGDSDRDQ
ncbi:MAG: hypothetical protein OJF47_000241 [Nitrospira sp.]|nr:MAG: hypothetical protein OJF47_000241 [Nitrospira sp.]